MAERAQRSLSASTRRQSQQPPSSSSTATTTPTPDSAASSSSSAIVSSSNTPRSSSEAQHATHPPRSPSIRVSSPPITHRHSFSDQLRGVVPPSPRTSRHFSQASLAAVQDLLNNPPKAGAADPAFAGRDWHTIAAGELVDANKDVVFVEVDTGIEDATHKLIDSGASVLLVREKKSDKSAVATFDYKDLNQYLLFATGSLKPDSEHLAFFQNLAKKAQQGVVIPIREAKSLGTKEPFVMLPHTAKLTKALEAFGSGVHRLIVVREWTNEVVGVLSQFRLVKFLWENGKSFPVIDQLYGAGVRDLGLGRRAERGEIVCINGDKPLREALLLLDFEGVTSLAVVDNQHNVVGNISTTDVKLLTKASSAPLLDNTCIHFISVILSARGLDDGKDSFPVFYISPNSTLAHTVAKLVATGSHRMWITTPPSPSPSSPPTPASGPPSAPPTQHSFPLSPIPPSHIPHTPTPGNTPTASSFPSSSSYTPLSSGPGPINAFPSYTSPYTSTPYTPTPYPSTSSSAGPYTPGAYTAMPPLTPTSSSPAVSAAALPGASISGRLSGVVSLTDVLNLFARASGLNPGDPAEIRREWRGRRRGSSSSSAASGSGSVTGLGGGVGRMRVED